MRLGDGHGEGAEDEELERVTVIPTDMRNEFMTPLVPKMIRQPKMRSR